ncbi:MAG: DsbA family protein [Legionellales bacterium]|nr:DsbA family protein [Legionellales bacterium]
MGIRSLFLVTLATLSLNTVAYAADNNTLSTAQQQQVQQIVHDYLLDNPQILLQVSQKLQEQQAKQVEQIQKNAQKIIPGIATQLFNDKSSPFSGSATGDVTMVEFFDYQCPHCKDMASILNNLQQQDSNLKIIYKEFPIFGADSQYAAAAALAAAQQGKYAQFHDALMKAPAPLTKEVVLDLAKTNGLDVDQLQKDIKSESVKKELKDNVQLAEKLQLLGTPAFVIANSKNVDQSVLVPGTTTQEVLQSLITQARSSKLSANN